MWCYYKDEVFSEFNMEAYVKQIFHILCGGVEPYVMSKEEHNFKVYENQSGPGYCSRCCDLLRVWRSRDWIPAGTRFTAPVLTGPGTHPASCTMITGSFPGIKRLRRIFDHPPLSSAEVKGGVELYLCSPSGVSRPVLGWTLHLSLRKSSLVKYFRLTSEKEEVINWGYYVSMTINCVAYSVGVAYCFSRWSTDGIHGLWW